MEAKNEDLLISGGGHIKAAGFTIEKNKLNSFNLFLDKKIKNYDENLFEKNFFFTDKISLNQIQQSLLLQNLHLYMDGYTHS